MNKSHIVNEQFIEVKISPLNEQDTEVKYLSEISEENPRDKPIGKRRKSDSIGDNPC